MEMSPGTEIELTGMVLAPDRVEGDDEADAIRRATAAWLLAKKSAHTRRDYARDLMGEMPRMAVPGWLPWCAARGLHPLRVRRGHVDAYARELEADYAAASVARRLSTVSSWYSYLVAEGLTESNPAELVDRPEVDRDVSHTIGLSDTETDTFLVAAEAEGPRASALLRLLLFGGFRVATAIGANVGDLGHDRGHRVLTVTLKGGTTRRATLVAPVCDSLDRYMADRPDARPDEPLFATATGRRLDEPYIWRLVRRVARRAGIPSADQLSPHGLRHTFATQARDLGVPLEDVQDAMGHKDPRTTRRYDRARNRLDRHPGFALAARFAQTPEQS